VGGGPDSDGNTQVSSRLHDRNVRPIEHHARAFTPVVQRYVGADREMQNSAV
jgi:hypothetical protein